MHLTIIHSCSKIFALREIKAMELSVSDQLTINEYPPGIGIAPHVDTHTAFEDGIACVSLGSDIVLDFRHPQRQTDFHAARWTPRRSLLVMTGEARWLWTHGIAARKHDRHQGNLIPRGRRVSLSFRKIRESKTCEHCRYRSQCDDRSAASTNPKATAHDKDGVAIYTGESTASAQPYGGCKGTVQKCDASTIKNPT